MKKAILYLITFILLISFVFALSITKFSDGTPSKNITYPAGGGEFELNVSLYEYSTITSAVLDLTEYNSSFICYQETANVSTSCGGLATGNYSTVTTDWDGTNPSPLVYDGDFSTYGFVFNPFGAPHDAYMYINYSKPTNALNSSLWQVKDGVGTVNLTIGDCWDYDNSLLSFRVRSSILNVPSPNRTVLWYCYNSTDWVQLREILSSFATYLRVYEEAMWWDISLYPTNVTIYANDEQIYFNSSINTSTTVDLNTTLLNLALRTCTYPSSPFCIIHLNLTSATDGILELSNLNITFNPYILNYSTYRILETSLQTFNISFANLTNSTNVYASIIYNGTLIDDKIPSIYPSYTNFVYTFNIPFITSTENIYNYSFYFDYNYTYPLRTDTEDSITYNQSVYKILLTNCSKDSISNVSALNFSIYEENNLTYLSADVEGIFYIDVEGTQRNITIDYDSVSNFSICLYPNWATFNLDAYLQYEPPNGYRERYYLENVTITNETQLINMYNFASTTGLSELSAILYNYYYAVYPNLITKLQRYYPATATWITVQIDKSDNFGKSLFYIYQNTVDYKFLFETEGKLIDQTVSLKFVCDSATECEQAFIVEERITDADLSGMTAPLTYNNETEVITLTWNDATNVVDTVRLLVEKQASDGSITICDTTVSASSGSINCDTSAYTGIITARAFRAASPEDPFIHRTIEKAVGSLSSLVDTTEGAIYGFLIMAVVVGFGAFSAVASVIMAILGLIVIYLFDIFTIINFSFVVGGIFLGVIVAFMVRRTR